MAICWDKRSDFEVETQRIAFQSLMSCPLKIKEALHTGWENPSLNKQVNH